MSTNRLLISKEDFYEFQPIVANGADPAQIMFFVEIAQKFDLVTVINIELIKDIQDDMGSLKNQALLPFIKPVLCYYSYARYVLGSSVSDSPYGMVTKTNEFSQPASEKTLQRMSTDARSLAYGYSKDLIDYLIANKTTYTLWKQSGCGVSPDKKSSFNITDASIR